MSKMPTAPRPKTITETREKSYTDQLLAFMPMWKLMGFEGLEGFERGKATKLADKSVAKRAALIDSCTQMEVAIDPDGDYFKSVDMKPAHELNAHASAFSPPQHEVPAPEPVTPDPAGIGVYGLTPLGGMFSTFCA